MLSVIYRIVVDFIVPGIMLVMFGVGIYLSAKVPQQFRLSAVAGLCAGLVAFAVYVVSSFTKFQAPALNVTSLPSFHWVPTIIGAVMGFAMLRVLQYLKLNAGLLGLFILVLIASSSIAAFSYFFASPLRDFAIYFALSTAVGMLLHVMLFPERIREILRS
ncbi:MAG TPA: hypothetical protein DHU96_11155 [Actinobacteria bacterium]|nr:hypothetical protein [Actinomycetota bacterium]